MQEQIIYLQKDLTPEVIKSLDKNETHFFICNNGIKLNLFPESLKKYSNVTHVIIPVTVKDEIITKKALEVQHENLDEGQHDYFNFGQKVGRVEGFHKAVYWLLNYKEDNK